ncbi:ferredoxin family protein, partial [Planctomycetota bacterium]
MAATAEQGVSGASGGAEALPRMWRRPLDADTIKVPRGEIVVIEERCKGCGFCVEFCPVKVLVLAERFNEKGYHPPEATTADNCVACHLCELL